MKNFITAVIGVIFVAEALMLTMAWLHPTWSRVTTTEQSLASSEEALVDKFVTDMQRVAPPPPCISLEADVVHGHLSFDVYCNGDMIAKHGFSLESADRLPGFAQLMVNDIQAQLNEGGPARYMERSGGEADDESE